jgi:hypothetical protein
MPSMPPDQATVDRRPVPGGARLPARLFGLPVLAALLWLPEAVWAEPRDGTAGGGAEIPAQSLLDQLLTVIIPLAGVAGILVVAIRIAIVIARLGPPAVRQPVAGPPPTAAHPPARRKGVLMVIGIGATLVGGLVGREIARENSVYSMFGGMIPTLFFLVTIGALIVIGLIALAARHGHPTFPISAMLIAAGTLAAGAVGGNVTARATGGTYIAPVVLEAPGTLTLAMPGVVGFIAATDVSARCQSNPDERDVADVVGLVLGELEHGTLRGSISPTGEASDEARVSLFIDGGDLPDGSSQPFWSGRARVIDRDPSGSSGKLTFSSLAYEDAAAKPGPTAPMASGAVFPATVSGTITWACQPW